MFDTDTPIFDQVAVDLTIESMTRSDEAALVAETEAWLELVTDFDLTEGWD